MRVNTTATTERTNMCMNIQLLLNPLANNNKFLRFTNCLSKLSFHMIKIQRCAVFKIQVFKILKYFSILYFKY